MACVKNTKTFGKRLEDALHSMRALFGAWKCRHLWTAIESRKIVFNQFQGSGFGCNQKYIALELLKRRKDLDLVWLVRNPDESGFPDGIRKVSWKSADALKELATSKVWCANHNLGHFIKNRGLIKKPGQFYVQTWHGSFGIKRCTETLGCKEATMLDVFTANSEWEANLAREWFSPSTPEIALIGHPRNDIIVNSRRQTFNNQKPTLLYVPTFRDDGATDCYLTDFLPIVEALKSRWPGDWKVQVRLHPHMRKKGVRLAFSEGVEVEDVTSHPDIQELLAGTDAVISDYSSCIFDFALSGRPAFIYAPDREKYESDRGFYYPLSDTPFPVGENMKQLVAAIRNFDTEAYGVSLENFFAEKGSCENGAAASLIADIISEKIDGVSSRVGELREESPQDIVHKTRRFDLFYKIALAQAWESGDEREISRAEQAYLEQIRAAVDFYEADNGKNHPEDFIKVFRKLLKSVKKDGYSKDAPPIPIDEKGDLLGGAHRLAACFVYGKKCRTICVGSRKTPATGYSFLMKRKMHPAVAEYGILALKRIAPQSVLAAEFSRHEERGNVVFPDWNRRLNAMKPTIYWERMQIFRHRIAMSLRKGENRKKSFLRMEAHRRRANGYFLVAEYFNRKG